MRPPLPVGDYRLVSGSICDADQDEAGPIHESHAEIVVVDGPARPASLGALTFGEAAFAPAEPETSSRPAQPETVGREARVARGDDFDEAYAPLMRFTWTVDGAVHARSGYGGDPRSRLVAACDASHPAAGNYLALGAHVVEVEATLAGESEPFASAEETVRLECESSGGGCALSPPAPSRRGTFSTLLALLGVAWVVRAVRRRRPTATPE
jgi:hypothetical protein